MTNPTSEQSSREQEREQFEVDAYTYDFDLERFQCAAPEPWSEYKAQDTGHRWAGWLARAERESAQPGYMQAIELAELFHQTYEELAPSFGYETRPETREFKHDSPNGALMVEVMRRLRPTLSGQTAESGEAPDAQLCEFYQVSTFSDLVATMERHIEKLQAKLPRNDQPAFTRVREG